MFHNNYAMYSSFIFGHLDVILEITLGRIVGSFPMDELLQTKLRKFLEEVSMLSIYNLQS